MNKLRIIGKAILEHHPNAFFSLDQIARLTKISRKYVTDVLVVFSGEGLIKKIAKQRKEHIPGYSPRFTLTYRVVDKKALAARIAAKLKEETIQDKMWFIIRKKKFFTLRDLIILTGAKRNSARWYFKALRRAGVIRPLRRGGPGVEWMLVRDCGPRRPYVKTNRKARNEKMKDKAETSGHKAKMDGRLRFWLSEEEYESVKRQASKRNLSVSAYVRMILREDPVERQKRSS